MVVQMDMVSCLEKLSSAKGVGGQKEAADMAEKLLKPYCDETEQDALGNVIGWMRCGKKDAPVLLLEAHIDEIGLVVTGVDESGFVHASACGGIDERTLTAAEVIVHSDKEYSGFFCSTPPHLRKAEDKGILPDIFDMGIDIGMSAEQAKLHIHPGDRISYRPNFRKINESRVCGKSLDDRSGIAAILYCMEILKKEKENGKAWNWDIAVAFAVQEELGCRGSQVSSYYIHPKAAIAVDVSFAYTPDDVKEKCGVLGKGPMIGWSPTLDDSLTRKLVALADKHQIPYQHEVMSGDTGTDADSIAETREGVRTALLSIPLRYMHTPVELIDINDVEAIGNLMAEFVQEETI